MSVCGQRPGWRARLRVRLSRGRLDRELADACVRDTSEGHALRARQLADPAARRRLACSLRRLLADAEDPRAALLGSTVPVLGDAVVPWREALLGLAERLEQTEPVNPLGLARMRVVLTDGMGPLYNRASERSLSEAVWWVVDGLQLCPPHDWRCPVVVKLDPCNVAWTCARCGSITTEDQAARPA
jgi:hypothetical protein